MAGLIGHIKTHFPAMYHLYLCLKDCVESPTKDEVAIASGKKSLDPMQAAEYLLELEKSLSNIVDAFVQQNKRVIVSIFSTRSLNLMLTL